MIFVKQTFDYLKKNIIYLMVFAIIPSVMYTLNNTSLNVYIYFSKLRIGQKFNLIQTYKYFSTINYNSILLTLLSLASTIIFVSLILAFIEKHMRIGKRSFKGVLNKLNDNIVPVFLLLLLFLCIFELWSVIISALMVMSAIIFSGKVLYFFCILIGIIFFILLFMVLGLFVIWLPCILITGFNYSEALIYSVSLMSEHKKDIIISLVVPYLLCNVIVAIVHFFIGYSAGIAVLIIAFILYFTYYTSLMYVIYFYLTNEKREDLKKKYF